MINASSARNRQIYDATEVAAHYAALNYLTPCERLLFETYIKPGSAVLDLGVGGGRTTPYLASRSSRYVGVDYAPAMVKVCQERFPGLEFVVADASDLHVFPDSSFDAVVFAFNGIDYALPDESRHACIEHIHRVLKNDGVVVFSSHNARAVLMPPRWNRDRLRRTAGRLGVGSRLLCGLFLTVLTSLRSALGFVQAAAATLPRLLRRATSRVFWRGEGNLVDSAHGGLLTHYSTPRSAIAELESLGFQPERVLGDEYPHSSRAYSTDWYYYVFVKRQTR
ncbi:MAG: class I SAM-dependent methyltransferase [Candidatus Sulfotelmatobacter sp.]